MEALATHMDVVRPEWVDPNGHMNIGYYAVAFDQATDGFFRAINIGFEQLHTGYSMFLVEMHMTLGQEFLLGEPLRFTSQLLGFDEKRVLFFHRVFHATKGFQAATCEILGLHVAMATRKTCPLNPVTRALTEKLWATHKDLPWPAEAGRAMGLRAKKPV
jgi:acyl-CoA thioester hydrolase